MDADRNKNQMFNVGDIVKRAKIVMAFKTDTQLAKFLGISRSTLSNWVARNSIDFPLLLSHFTEVDYTGCCLAREAPCLTHRIATTSWPKARWRWCRIQNRPNRWMNAA